MSIRTTARLCQFDYANATLDERLDWHLAKRTSAPIQTVGDALARIRFLQHQLPEARALGRQHDVPGVVASKGMEESEGMIFQTTANSCHFDYVNANLDERLDWHLASRTSAPIQTVGDAWARIRFLQDQLAEARILG
jgi:hypothetical protein